MQSKVNWPLAIKPLLKKYEGRAHPLEYNSIYQLLVMVVLSAQDSDKNINKLAPAFFKSFPNMIALARANKETLFPLIGKVRNFANKTNWLLALAQQIKKDKNIPLTMEELIELPGIGRKSSNVIMREAGVKSEGIIVDLHVVRVAPRLGIVNVTDPKKIEKQLMEIIPQKDWDIGMAMSFHGREICRPKEPKCLECVMNPVCDYFKSIEVMNKKAITKTKNTVYKSISKLGLQKLKKR